MTARAEILLAKAAEFDLKSGGAFDPQLRRIYLRIADACREQAIRQARVRTRRSKSGGIVPAPATEVVLGDVRVE